jgi:GNAT superfamily N-acetyltransferase
MAKSAGRCSADLCWARERGRRRLLHACRGYVTRENAPERLAKGLARLAVDHRWQGQGAGNAFLKDAMLRTLQAADIAGIRAFAVHAKDDEARRFYLKFDFIPSPSDPMHLFVLLKEVRRIVSGPE